MSSFKKILLGLSFLFFAGGIIWGVKFRSKPTVLTMVCSDAWMPREILAPIESRLNVQIQWQNYSNWAELYRLIGNHQGRFDLICTHSFLARDLIASGWMDEFNPVAVPDIKNIASDFKQMPFDPQGTHFIPLGWLINAFLTEASRPEPSWKALWPAQASQLVLNYPDLELYWRMRMGGLELDPEKQERHNQDSQGYVKQFLNQLGGIKHSNENAIASMKSAKVVQANNKVWLNQTPDLKQKYKLTELSDGVSVWFLLVGVGKHSKHKEEAHEVLSELLSAKVSNDLRIQRGFAHVLGQFDNAQDIPTEMKASFIRSFSLRALKFPDVSLEGLPQWETMMKQETKESGQFTGTR